jgi:hypothetical protein
MRDDAASLALHHGGVRPLRFQDGPQLGKERKLTPVFVLRALHRNL